MRRQELLQRVAGLIERGQKLEIIVPQDTGFFTLDRGRIDGILELLAATVETLLGVTTSFEEDPPAQIPGSALSPQEVADLAFIGRGELHGLHGDLTQAVATGNMWKIASAGDRAVARTVRALIPVEASLRQYASLPPIERTWFDLDDALEIRQRFIGLWLLIRRADNQGEGHIREAMQNLAQEIDRLRQAEIYPFIRIDDRLQLRSLQKRLLTHLESSGATADGQRLWQDAVGFFDLLMHINRREELRDHDRMLVGRVLRDLYDLAHMPQQMPAESHVKLLSLASQEASLDDLLIRLAPSRSAAYREPLERLRNQLVS